jgi:hypothetical protein
MGYKAPFCLALLLLLVAAWGPAAEARRLVPAAQDNDAGNRLGILMFVFLLGDSISAPLTYLCCKTIITVGRTLCYYCYFIDRKYHHVMLVCLCTVVHLLYPKGAVAVCLDV